MLFRSSRHVNFDWSHSNLEQGIKHGIEAAKRAVALYRRPPEGEPPWIIKESDTDREERKKKRAEEAQERTDFRTAW